ncbi:MAG: Asp-tRNA(Asn)/Glu-tRNA(Gln) amidotransferase subunit GatC [Acidobacteriaceae bacterium]
MPNGSDVEHVSLEDVRRVAELAHLELTPDEESRMSRDLSAILDYVAQLAELDTSHVAPMAQVAEILAASTETAPEKRSVLRDDLPRPCLPRDQVMAGAPETDGACFKVPKVIER